MGLLPDWIDSEFKNWARACWSGSWPHPLPPDHAMSIEGRFVPPAGEVFDPPEPRMPRPNMDRAAVVQTVFDSRLTQPERLALIFEYPKRLRVSNEDQRISRSARKVGVPRHMYVESIQRAGRMVAQAFEEAGR